MPRHRLVLTLAAAALVMTGAGPGTAVEQRSCSTQRAVDITEPWLSEALARGSLHEIETPLVRYTRDAHVSRKVSSGRSELLTPEGQRLFVQTTCTLECTSPPDYACFPRGCDLWGSNCTAFTCSGIGACSGTCTKKSVSIADEFEPAQR